MRRMVLGITFALLAASGATLWAAQMADEPGGDDGSCGTVYNYRSGSGGDYSFAHTGPGGVQAYAGWTYDSSMHQRSNTGEVQLYANLAQNISRHAFCAP